MPQTRGRSVPLPPRPTLVVDVSDRQSLLRISARGLERLVRSALIAEGVEQAEIGVILVDDRRIAAVHRRWLGLAGPTDVITFDLSAGTAGPPDAGVFGAVGWTPRQELAYYIVHGVLHLTGYNDDTAADRRQMRARERAVMKACGLPVPPRTKAAGTPP